MVNLSYKYIKIPVVSPDHVANSDILNVKYTEPPELPKVVKRAGLGYKQFLKMVAL